MKNLNNVKKIAIVSIVFSILIATILVYGFLGKSKAGSDELVNFGAADNNDHSGDTEYNITKSDSVKYTSDNIENGVILQAWCWSFDTIKELMPQIKAAGYTSVQTSPINKCRIGETNNDYSMSLSNWYYHYQPTNYTIGNYQLGTEEEFKEMCAVADKYGISVIVDVVVNHMSSQFDYLDSEWKNYNYFHTNQEIYDWNTRYGITRFALVGLWDLKTEDSYVQQRAKDFLVQCVKDGASGFRYDAAKHIELPDDSNCGSNFWPTVLDNGATYQYGEVLGEDENMARTRSYINYMDVATEVYGNKLRSGVGGSDFGTDNLLNYGTAVDPKYLVTWVESHDNFTTKERTSTWMTDEQITLCWAVLAARKESTPLFYSRPVGAGGTTYDSRFTGLSQIGDEGSSLYKSDSVVEVNIFRNTMEGQNEYLRNINDNKILMVERGTKGAVIVNLNYSSVSISSATNLANDEYYSHTNNNEKFVVSNGTISGTLPARSVTVLYNDGSKSKPSVAIDNYTDNYNNIFTSDYLSLNLSASNYTNATYSINNGKSYKYNDGKCINIGWGMEYNSVITVELRAENSSGTTSAIYTFTKKNPDTLLTIYFEKPAGWGTNINAYIYKTVGSSISIYSSWPGAAMCTSGDGVYSLCIDGKDFENGMVIFNDGSSQTPGSGKDGFTIVNNGSYDVNGYVKTITPTPSPIVTPVPTATIKPTNTPGPTTAAPTSIAPTNTPVPTVKPSTISVHFEKPSNWSSTVYAYIYNESGSNVTMITSWPGTKMNLTSDNVYELSFDSSYEGKYVIFTDNSNQVPATGKTGFIINNYGYYDKNGLVKVLTPSPAPTATIKPTETPSPTATVKPTESPAPTATVKPTEAPTPIPSNITVQFEKPSNWSSTIYAYIYSGDGEIKLAAWPGAKMTSVNDNVYEITFSYQYDGAYIIFSDGSHQVPGSGQDGFIVTNNGYYTSQGYKKQIGEETEETTFKIYYASSWQDAYIHYKTGTGSWTSAPGIKMESSSYSGFYYIEITPGSNSSLTCCFNNGKSNWDNNNNNNYNINTTGIYTIKNGNIVSGLPQ